jgi:hypothetical protein
VTKPFDLHTAKRLRLQDENEPCEDYEPLTEQLAKNFQLRTAEKIPDKPKKLTRPKSPPSHVKERLALKVTSEPSEDSTDKQNFKARPINPHLFEHASRLPFVERKSATNFNEFRLSSSNAMLGKRTFNEYMQMQQEQKTFKAKAFNREMFERPSLC